MRRSAKSAPNLAHASEAQPSDHWVLLESKVGLRSGCAASSCYYKAEIPDVLRTAKQIVRG